MLAYPKQLADVLAGAAQPPHASSFFGDGGFLANVYAADPRLSQTANTSDWVVTFLPTVGGYPLANVTSTTTLSFAPADPFDTVDVYDIAIPERAVFGIAFDGNVPTLSVLAPPPGSALAVRRSTARVSLGNHMVGITPASRGATIAGTVLIGIDTFDSTRKDAAVWNLGWSGSQTSDWAGGAQPYAPLAVLKQLAPQVTIINLGINDMGQRVSPEAYRANLQKIIEAVRSVGDVLLVVPNRFEPAAVSDATQDAFAAVLSDLSKQYDLPLLNLAKLLGTFSEAKAAGFMTDGVHPSAKGGPRGPSRQRLSRAPRPSTGLRLTAEKQTLGRRRMRLPGLSRIVNGSITTRC